MRDDILEMGLGLLAATTREHGAQWFMGHDGAVLLAGHFMLNELELGEQIEPLIEASLGRWLAADVTTPAPAAVAGSASLESLIDALSACCRTLSASGHGVIFGALALKAFTRRPALATPALINGIIALLLACQQEQRPDRYFGIADYRLALPDTQEFDALVSIEQLGSQALAESAAVYADGHFEGSFYFFGGNPLHSITWAQALLDIKDCGYGALADSGVLALKQHMLLCRRRPDALKPIISKTLHDPRELEFWQRDLDEWHQIKLAYAVIKLLDVVPDTEQAQLLANVSPYWDMRL